MQLVRTTARALCSCHPRGHPKAQRARLVWAGSLQRSVVQIHPHTRVHAHMRTLISFTHRLHTHERAHTHTCPCTRLSTGYTHACVMHAGPGGSLPCDLEHTLLAALDPACFPGWGARFFPEVSGCSPGCRASWRAPALPKMLDGSKEHAGLRSAAGPTPAPLTQPLSAIAEVPKRES